jgi:nitrite reductase/ring-hydroxylating ferredoxin subunit
MSDNEGKRQNITIFNMDGIFHGISNVCAHEGGPLNEGTLEKAIVTCL